MSFDPDLHPREPVRPGQKGRPYASTRSDEEDATIVDLYRRGMMIRDVARQLGRSPGFTSERLEALGVRQRTWGGRRGTPEEFERIREMYVDLGVSSVDIAREIGRSPEFVWRNLKRMGVRTGRKHSPKTRLSYDEMQRTADLYRGGMTMAEVGRELGVSQGTVWYRLRQFGVARRSRTEHRASRPTPRSRDDLREMIAVVKLYRAGLSMEQIAAELGTHGSWVRRRLVWAGEPRRSLQDARQNHLERRAQDSNLDLGLMRPAA